MATQTRRICFHDPFRAQKSLIEVGQTRPGKKNCFYDADDYYLLARKTKFSMNWKCLEFSAMNACETTVTALSGQWVRFALVLILLGSICRAALGDDYCSDCMATAMKNHAEGVMAGIQKNWAEYQQVLELVRKFEKDGTEQQKAQAREILAQAKEKWKPYESMAHAFASPEFAAQLDGYKDYLSGQLQKEKERLQKETELYKTLAKSTEDQRQRIMGDIAGFEKESAQLKNEFYADLGLGAWSSIGTMRELAAADKLKAIKPVKGWDEMIEKFSKAAKNKRAVSARNKALAQLAAEEAAGKAIVRNGPRLTTAMHQGNSSEIEGAAVQLVADTGLQTIRALMAAKPAMAASVDPLLTSAAARSGYLMLVAPALDNVLIANALHRLDQADQRLQDVTATEKGWQSRIKTFGDEVNSTERRLQMVEAETTLQRQVAKINEEIEAASKE